MLTQDDAAMKMAGFGLLAVAARPIGGWLPDRFAATRVLGGAFAVVLTPGGTEAAGWVCRDLGAPTRSFAQPEKVNQLTFTKSWPEPVVNFR